MAEPPGGYFGYRLARTLRGGTSATKRTAYGAVSCAIKHQNTFPFR